MPPPPVPEPAAAAGPEASAGASAGASDASGFAAESSARSVSTVGVFVTCVWILTSRAPEVPEADGGSGSVLSKEIGAGLHLSASPLLLRRVLQAHPTPRRTVVLAGYAGWGPGQLDEELAASAWLIAPVELDLIFEIPSAVCWDMAMKRLGMLG